MAKHEITSAVGAFDELGARAMQGYVDLSSLTTLPEGVSFSNQGDVDLSSLTTLPEGVSFSNQGDVDLSSLTTLPEGVSFSNQGDVDLRSLTTLPEGVSFNNQGYVYVPDGEYTYLGRRIRIINIDRYSMWRKRKAKSTAGIEVFRAAYFGGGDLEDLATCFIAKEGELYAHGSTLREAIDDVRFKQHGRINAQDLADEIKARGTISVLDYRLLTGACREGIREFLTRNGFSQATSELPLAQAIALVVSTKAYGFEEIQSLFSGRDAQKYENADWGILLRQTRARFSERRESFLQENHKR